MRWVGSAFALWLAAMAAMTVASCSSGSGSPLGGGAFCSRAASFVRGCGFQQTANAAAAGNCEEPPDAQARCLAECFFELSCPQVVDVYCRGQFQRLLECQVGCPAATFLCADGSSVESNDRCDGFDDCADQSDEAGCPMFTCGDGTTVPESFKCDEFDDCADGSDEVGCPVEPDLEAELAADCAALGVPQ